MAGLGPQSLKLDLNMPKPNPPIAINRVISDRMIRQRTYEITRLRDDGGDVLPQLLVTIQQLLSDSFTGRITLNCSSGGVMNIHVEENQRVPT